MEVKSGELLRAIIGTEKDIVDILTRTPRKWRAGTKRMKVTAIGGMWISSSGGQGCPS